MVNMIKGVKVSRSLNAVAAGITVQNGAVIDMQGFDGVQFILLVGALTATQVTGLKAQQGNASNLSDAADLAGSAVGPLADGDGNKALVLDVYRPLERYIRPVVTRATANAVIDGVIAIQYRGRKAPVTQDTTFVAANKMLVSPAEGTA